MNGSEIIVKPYPTLVLRPAGEVAPPSPPNPILLATLAFMAGVVVGTILANDDDEDGEDGK